MYLLCKRCYLLRHSWCPQISGLSEATWEEEASRDIQDEAQGEYEPSDNEEIGDGYEPEAEQPVKAGLGLGAFFEEDDEEEGTQVQAGRMAAETQELLELYELAGLQVPRLAGPDCFSANDITYGQGLIIPTQEDGGWMPAIPILEDLLECKQEGLFKLLSGKALQKWKVNKPIKLKTGIELQRGAVPLCEALATLRDVATETHQGCKKPRYLAQQNNGLPYICCSIHHTTPEYNYVRITGWLVAATSTLCLQGFHYPQHKDKWMEVLCDDRRLILLEYTILWNVYLMNDVAVKVNRPELRLCPPRLVGGAAASIQAKADAQRKQKALPTPKTGFKRPSPQQRLSFSKGTPSPSSTTGNKLNNHSGKGGGKRTKMVTPIKMKSIGDMTEEQREAAFSDYMAKQGF
jgi:hypothetical protein